MSKASRKLQIQLFRALLVKTMIPIIFEYLPCAVTFLSPLFANCISYAAVVYKRRAKQCPFINILKKCASFRFFLDYSR
ncbi:unnamed protein product, partial [Mesorhabditis belari]|uniref:Uncharacterized protein n=1 Tax=Mesorhabditis belari TaxID=2138241 RepID=A0AAF3ES45_9BILA